MKEKIKKTTTRVAVSRNTDCVSARARARLKRARIKRASFRGGPLLRETPDENIKRLFAD